MATAKMIKEVIAGKEIVFDNSIIQGNHKTVGVLYNTNKNRKDLVVYDTHSWSGDVTRAYPTVPYNDTGRYEVFIHQGLEGSKGGVVYADGTDSTARKWLVAFDTPNNKCYVEAGPIGPIDWNVVEVYLDKSEGYSNYTDPVFGGKASARVHSVDDVTNRRLDVFFSY